MPDLVGVPLDLLDVLLPVLLSNFELGLHQGFHVVEFGLFLELVHLHGLLDLFVLGMGFELDLLVLFLVFLQSMSQLLLKLGSLLFTRSLHSFNSFCCLLDLEGLFPGEVDFLVKSFLSELVGSLILLFQLFPDLLLLVFLHRQLSLKDSLSLVISMPNSFCDFFLSVKFSSI